MNRRITYASQLANSLFALQDQNEYMFDYSVILSAILGEITLLDGLACTPTMTPSLTVNVAPGSIFINEVIDATDFGTPPSVITADSRLIQKFAYTLDPTPFTFVPPTTPGDSRNDLIQVAFQEVDGVSTGLPFFGGTTDITVLTPTGTAVIPVANNSITTTVNVERLDNIVITVVPGTPAPTGTQVTPSPTGGATGAWVITTTEGTPTITSGDIAAYSSAPFIGEKLTAKAGIVEVQNNTYVSSADTGTANNYVLTFTPAITAYVKYQTFLFQATNANTGASTIIANGLSSKNIVRPDGTPLLAGDIPANGICSIFYDGSEFVLLNAFALNPQTLMPTGAMVDYAGSTAPTGFLLCDGSSQLVASYPTLFGVIGYDYGGSGANFNLPDPRGRSTVGAGSGPGLTPRVLAAIGGEELHVLTIAELASHNHTFSYIGSGGTPPSEGTNGNDFSRSNIIAAITNFTGGDTGHNTMHPFLVLNRIIKT
jgi:microcystin-dependent protein